MDPFSFLSATKIGKRTLDVLKSKPLENDLQSLLAWLETRFPTGNTTEPDVRAAASTIKKIKDRLDIMKLLYLTASQPEMKTRGLCWLYIITGEPVNDGDGDVDVHVTYEALEELDVIPYCFKLADGKYLVPSSNSDSYILLEEASDSNLHVSQTLFGKEINIPLQEVDTTELAKRRVSGYAGAERSRAFVVPSQPEEYTVDFIDVLTRRKSTYIPSNIAANDKERTAFIEVEDSIDHLPYSRYEIFSEKRAFSKFYIWAGSNTGTRVADAPPFDYRKWIIKALTVRRAVGNLANGFSNPSDAHTMGIMIKRRPKGDYSSILHMAGVLAKSSTQRSHCFGAEATLETGMPFVPGAGDLRWDAKMGVLSVKVHSGWLCCKATVVENIAQVDENVRVQFRDIADGVGLDATVA